MRFKNLWVLGVLLAACAVRAGAARAGESGDEPDDGVRRTVALSPENTPAYRHPYENGLYSTVTAMNTFWVPEVKEQKKLKLKVPGFKKEVPVCSILQNYGAPLIVVLMGVDGKVDGPWGGLFPYWYHEAGYHVLTFDSTFTPQYPALSGQGVAGNFDAETDQIAAVIGAYLKTPEAGNRVTKVGVVGMSFGATQALLLAAKSKAGKLPFDLAGCLALSPPVSLRTAARVVDRFFSEDRWETTMIQLAERFGPHVPVAAGQPIPFKDTEMRAAIGFVFRDGVTQVVERNDRAYNLRILPSDDSLENRGSYAEATGFERFIDTYTFPYWQKKGVVKSADELWAMADLSKILPRLPDYAVAVVAQNDPFNLPGELAAAQAADQNHNLIVLPNGGHLGFVAADWTLSKALQLFQPKSGAAPVNAPAARQLGPADLDQARRELREATREANEALKAGSKAK